MKTTKTFRLLAVLLAMLLAFGAMPALAVEIDSSDYAVWTQNAVNDLYERLMAAENYSDYSIILNTLNEAARDSFFNALTEEQQAALEEHFDKLIEASNTPVNVVSVTKPGPLVVASAYKGPMKAMAVNANDADNKVPEGLKISKIAKKNDDGSYTITLESYVTGSVKTTVTSKPVDIVLVLDVSGSMDYCLEHGVSNHSVKVYGDEINPQGKYYVYADKWEREVYYNESGNYYYYYYGYYEKYEQKVTPKTSADDNTSGHTQFYKRCTTRLEALKTAVNSFIDQVASESDGVDNRIAIVKFAGNNSEKVGNDTYYSGKYEWGYYNYSQTVTAMTAVKGNENTLKSAISALSAGGATQADYGMAHAASIIKNIDSKRDSAKVVVMFTDGQPTSGSEFENKVANSAINSAKSIKEAGATVYTVGVFNGANPNTTSDDTNKYMHYVSSNYLNATSLDKGGDRNDPNKQYYLATSSASELNGIFKDIAKEATTAGTANIKIDSTAVVKDVITPYFAVPSDASQITAEIIKCTSYDGTNATWEKSGTRLSNEKISIDADNRTVSVKGFDYANNFVSQNGYKEGNKDEKGDYHGAKLRISFTVKPRDDFLGGNAVVTNGDDSGIYDGDGKVVGKFDVPEVDVPIGDVDINPADANVYLGASYSTTVTSKEIEGEMTLKIGGVTVDLKKPDENYGLEDWQNKYVDIKVEIKDEGGNVVTDFKMVEDKKYTVTVTVTPMNEGDATAKAGDSKGTIHVFTPELTFKDNKVDYQSSLDGYEYAQKDYVGTKWRHQDVGDENVRYSTDEGVKMLGNQAAPSLNLSYTPTTGVDTNNKVTATDYVPVKVTVKIGAENVTSKTTFVHQACAADRGCQWNADTMKDGDPAFLLHVIKVYGDLTITKTGLNKHTYSGSADQESAIFKVTSAEDSTKSWIVAINGDGFVTLTGLKVGSYTVTELNSWTWRYADQNEQKVDVEGGKENTVTFNNRHTNQQWLGGDNYANNVFAAPSPAPTTGN